MAAGYDIIYKYRKEGNIMQKSPFEILGVKENVTQEELYRAYKKERSKYDEMRFEPGERGAEACARIDEIELAYRDAKDILAAVSVVEAEVVVDGVTGNRLDTADQLIKEKKYNEARAVLDSIDYKNGQWYYLSSIINYAQGNKEAAKDDLEKAVNEEPTNERYKSALNRLNAKMAGGPGANRTEYYAREGGQSPYTNRHTDRGEAPRRGVGPCDICAGLLCADCCCECMGGDLISCC